MKKLPALFLCLALLPALAACNSEKEKQLFADTLYIDYITPEDEVYARENELEAAVASMLLDAIGGAPDVSVNLRRRERFGPVDGEPAPDGEIVLAPRMNADGVLDFNALACDIAKSIAEGMGLGEEVVAALGGTATLTTSATTGETAVDVTTVTGTAQTTSTTKATTTSKKPETAPEKWSPPQVVKIGRDISADQVSESVREDVFANTGNMVIHENEYGSFLICKAPNQSYSDGLTLYVLHSPTGGNGEHKLIPVPLSSHEISIDRQYSVALILEPTRKTYNNYNSIRKENQLCIDVDFVFDLSGSGDGYLDNGFFWTSRGGRVALDGEIANMAKLKIYQFTADGTMKKIN